MTKKILLSAFVVMAACSATLRGMEDASVRDASVRDVVKEALDSGLNDDTGAVDKVRAVFSENHQKQGDAVRLLVEVRHAMSLLEGAEGSRKLAGTPSSDGSGDIPWYKLDARDLKVAAGAATVGVVGTLAARALAKRFG